MLLAAIPAILPAGCSGERKSDHVPAPPLILLFSIDTVRADHLGCYGYHRPTSPFIDRFASRATFFQNAVSQSAVTTPSHMSIFTSLMPVVHQIHNPNPFDGTLTELADNIPTLAGELRDKGWRTAGLHGGGPLSPAFGFSRGFDLYRDDFFFNYQTPYYQPRRELETIQELVRESRENEQPLFLFLHHKIPHDPYLASPPRFLHRFLEDPAPGLPLSRDDFRRRPDGGYDEESFWDGVDYDNPRHLRHMIDLYDGEILYSDYIFQQVVTILQAEGIYDDSLIILLSDHGEEFNEHGGYRHWKLFVETLNVPLIVKFPGEEFAGKTIEPHVRTLDLLPTLFEYLGIPIYYPVQGVSFLPLLTGKGEYAPLIASQALDVHSPDDVQFRESIRFLKDGYSYSNQLSAGLWRDSLEKGQPEWLFNLEADPREQVNLIDEKPELAARMREKADELLESNRAFREIVGSLPAPPRAPDDELRRQLEALGYLRDDW